MPADKKTREPTEGTATAIQSKHGDSCSENRVDLNPKRSTSFGDDSTGPPALPCLPKSCLSLLETHIPIAAGGLLPAGTTSTATRTPFDQPSLLFV